MQFINEDTGEAVYDLAFHDFETKSPKQKDKRPNEAVDNKI